MVPDASSSANSSFDFNSQAGVLAVLGAIRTSGLSAPERNELRDLVFLYSNGGGDQAVRTVLEERLRQANITPNSSVVPSAKAEIPASTPIEIKSEVSAPTQKPVTGFSGGRPVPFFTPGSVSETKSAPSVGITPPAAVTPVQPIRETVPVQSTPVRPVVTIPKPVAPVAPVPETVATPLQTPVVPEPVVSTPVLASTASVEVPTNAASVRLERIRQIKSEVNSRVGNPVNLVEIDNALGREYMSALLEAMKLINDAPEAESTRAMNRLEAAYTQVRSLLEQPQPTPTPVPPPVAPVVSPVTPAVSSAPVVQPVAASEVIRESASQLPPWGEADSVAELVTAVPEKPHLEVQSPVPPPLTPITQPSSVTVVNPVPVSPFGVQSVAASQSPLRSISELPTADEVNSVSAGGDPLFTKEVDAGLQQLLSEWSLFKKSGLFGTGPSGREHPLFLKIAPLPIPLLLAGRFEGSTQEIKQSVTDYMNGWRYEQGIVYEKDETFERYLRRVIRHIIDLQNKKRGA